jgi:putative redox protein
VSIDRHAFASAAISSSFNLVSDQVPLVVQLGSRSDWRFIQPAASPNRGENPMNSPVNFDRQRSQQTAFGLGRIIVAETGANPHQQLLFSGRHVLLADRSAAEGGSDTGPDPAALMMMARGSQLSMTLRAGADKNGWRLAQIIVRFDDPGEDRPRRPNDQVNNRRMACAIELIGDLNDWQQAQLIRVADRQLRAWRSLVAIERVADDDADEAPAHHRHLGRYAFP